MQSKRKRLFSVLSISLFSLVIFSSVLADNVTSQNSADTVKQQLVQVLTKLISELETKLQGFLKNLTQAPIQNTSTSTQSTSTSATSSNVFSLKIPTVDNTSSAQLPSIFTKSVKVYTTTPYQAKPGQKIVVEGTGFDSISNDFYFGGSIQTVGCVSSTTCEVAVPISTPIGKQSVSLSNKNGTSANQGFPVSVDITNSPVNPSVITGITPDTVNDDSSDIEIVISGTGFESGGNYIYSPVGRTGPFSSDGKKISFNLKSITNLDIFFKRIEALNAGKLPLPIRVYNDYGMSELVYLYVNLKK